MHIHEQASKGTAGGVEMEVSSWGVVNAHRSEGAADSVASQVSSEASRWKQYPSKTLEAVDTERMKMRVANMCWLCGMNFDTEDKLVKHLQTGGKKHRVEFS